MKYSKQRELILSIINNTKIHPTAEEVHQIAKETIPNISLGTVYRNLNTLVQTNQIIKLTVPNDSVHYDNNHQKHDHLHCLKCNKIFDIYLDDQTVLEKKTMKKYGYHIVSHEIMFTGYCNNCK